MRNYTKNLRKNKGLITVKEAARILGIDPFTVYRRIWREKLKFVRIGHRIFIPANAIEGGERNGDKNRVRGRT